MVHPDLHPDFPLGVPQCAPDSALRAFFADHADSPLDRLVVAIRGACRRGEGDWYDPQDRPPVRRIARPDGVLRPTSHLVEIRFLGVSADGYEPINAADNWRRAARNILNDARALA